tara:strand:- start:43 stop:180 length:138 start_codon:yes stop_codon:yes gene_type:complete
MLNQVIIDTFEVVEITADMNNDDVYVHLKDSYGYEYKGMITGVME